MRQVRRAPLAVSEAADSCDWAIPDRSGVPGEQIELPKQMAIKRVDHVSFVVDKLAAAKESIPAKRQVHSRE